jgi:hypothetical protein
MGFIELPDITDLEVLVRKYSEPYANIVDFRTLLASREAAVCRVETTTGFGTGSLVAPDLVLTNHHVVAKSLDAQGRLMNDLVCRFDYKHARDGSIYEGVTVRVVDVPASLPHAEADANPNGENTDPDKLDYALLRLDRKIGELPIVDGGDARGFIQIGNQAPSPEELSGLVVLQHPKAKPMKVDIGAVKWVGATRIRHTVNTESGSSGSPIFDAGLNLIAIHHAGYDWPRIGYPHNQGIPIGLIAAHARSKGLNI